MLALASAGCLWGTGFLFGKFALRELSVPHMILYRLALSCVAFLPVLLLNLAPIKKRDLALLVGTSIIGVPILYLLQFYGLSHTTVSHAALMVGTLPMLLAGSAVLLTHERLHGPGWVAVAGSSVGALLIVASAGAGHRGVHPTFYGDLLVFISMMVAVAFILLCKRLMTRYPPIIVTCYSFLIGTVVLAVWVISLYGLPPVHLSHRTWLALGAQGIFATSVATIFWNWGLSRVPASVAGIFVNFEPLIGSILGVTILHERLGPLALVGGCLILGSAAYLSQRTA